MIEGDILPIELTASRDVSSQFSVSVALSDGTAVGRCIVFAVVLLI